MKLNISTIDEIAELIKTGKTPPTKNKKYFDGEIDWFTPGDLEKSFYLQESERTITKEAIRDNKAVVFPKGTVLISCIGNIGKVGFCFSEQSSSNQQITGILPTEDVASEYLYYWVKANKKILEHNSNNAVVPILNNAALKRIKIKYPSFENQKQIVKTLDTADTLRQKRKEQLNLLDDYIKSVFFEMFGGLKEKKMLGVLTNKITDGVHSKPQYVEVGVPFISVVNITTGELKFENCKYISQEAHEKYVARCFPEYDDILYTKVGATYGRAAIVNCLDEFSLYVSVALIKPKKELISPLYLREAMNSHIVKRQADRSIKGIGVPDLHLIEIKRFEIPFPSMRLQNKFASIVKQVEQTKQKMRASLDEMDNHFNALMQRYFG
jgi:type I restriction enzyme S subunit